MYFLKIINLMKSWNCSIQYGSDFQNFLPEIAAVCFQPQDTCKQTVVKDCRFTIYSWNRIANWWLTDSFQSFLRLSTKDKLYSSWRYWENVHYFPKLQAQETGDVIIFLLLRRFDTCQQSKKWICFHMNKWNLGKHKAILVKKR